MSKTNSDASTSYLSSSDEESIPLTNSKNGEATTSKPTAIKKVAAVVPDPEFEKGVATARKPTAIKKAAAVLPNPESESSDSESETLVATKAKGKSGHAIKKAAAVETNPESESADSESERKTKERKEKSSYIIKKTAAESETKAKGARKEKSRYTIKKAVVSKPSTPAKRVVVVSPDEPSAKKVRSPSLFQRLWTEEDEITVLKQIVKYKEEKGVYALKDTKAFHAFVKDAMLVDFDFDRKQLAGKAPKFKNKYKKSSGKKNLTPHEEKLKKLSELIRGASSMKKDAAVSNCSVKKADAVSNCGVKSMRKQEDAAEDDAADAAEDDVEDAAEDDTEDAAEDAVEDDAEDDAEDETNNVCKMKKEWKFIGKKSIAMGFDAETVNAGLERSNDVVKVEIEEEWK